MTSVFRDKKRWLVVWLGFLAITVPARAAGVADALQLQAQGKLKESQALLRQTIGQTRAAGDSAGLARALSVSSRVSISLGDYRAAIRDATEAVSLRARLKSDAGLSEDYNTLGLANQYLGNYDAALSDYRKALDLDRLHHSAEAEVARENNIGNVFYFWGRYQDALRTYEEALAGIDRAGAQAWVPRRRELMIANLAALYQRLGKEQMALDLYRQLTGRPQALPRAEYAQLLLNEGVLYRRLGDPVKALEQYRAAQAIFAMEHHRDGEIGALRNIGIARAIDLNDLNGALVAFSAALSLARQSSDTRGVVQATLYRAEVLSRQGRPGEAEDDLRMAVAGAKASGLAEEQWKANYGLGKLAEAENQEAAARKFYGEAIAGIESVRSGVRQTTLRSEFLADKRDVYDSLIALDLRQPQPDWNSIFELMERSRARAFEERSGAAPAQQLSIAEVRGILPPETVFIEFWAGEKDAAALWITRWGEGVHRETAAANGLAQSIGEFERSLEDGGAENWRKQSLELGKRILQGIPPAKHVIAALDGPFALLPLETLTSPKSGRLLIEDSDVSYVPAARFLSRMARSHHWRLPPWRTELLAFGDPGISGTDALGSDRRWQAIPAAADEVRSIARLLPGRSEIYLGAAATKRRFLSRHARGISLLHFSTHAVVDAENPDRSRILLASESLQGGSAYLFQQEVYGLDLRDVDLATISACETARGKTVRGDGVQAFSQAFLAAGAAATVTSLWRVADRPAAEFMKQFYYFLARGQPKAEALRSAKLRFLDSQSRWSAPRYWSAFVLNGDGSDPCTPVLSWNWLLGAAGGIILIVGIWIGTRRPRIRRLPKAS